MILLCKIGRLAGTLVDYPYLIGKRLLEDGRASLPTTEEPEKKPVKPAKVKKVSRPAKRKRAKK
jgi:hypothetical protein